MSERTPEEALRIIKNAENEIIRLETQSDSALKTLKEKYEISSITEGDTYLDKKDAELVSLENELSTKKESLEKDFPWE
jgi:hypothetical protein